MERMLRRDGIGRMKLESGNMRDLALSRLKRGQKIQ